MRLVLNEMSQCMSGRWEDLSWWFREMWKCWDASEVWRIKDCASTVTRYRISNAGFMNSSKNFRISLTCFPAQCREGFWSSTFTEAASPLKPVAMKFSDTASAPHNSKLEPRLKPTLMKSPQTTVCSRGLHVSLPHNTGFSTRFWLFSLTFNLRSRKYNVSALKCRICSLQQHSNPE